MKVLDPRAPRLDAILEEIICRPRTVLAFIGTRLRSDDRFGLLLYSLLRNRIDYENAILCEFGLENCIDKIEERKPVNLVVFDGVVADAPPGSIVIADLEDLDEGFLATTHNVPIALVVKYLRSMNMAINTVVVGVRVSSLELSEKITPVVEKTTRILADKIVLVIRKCLKKSVQGE